MRLRAAESKTRLFFSVENDNLKTRFALYAREPFAAVLRFANGARGHDAFPFRAELVGECGHSAQREDRRVGGFVAQATGQLYAGAKPRRGLHLIDDANAAVRRDVGDYLPNRVRADVDRRDADVRIGARRMLALNQPETRLAVSHARQSSKWCLICFPSAR